MQFSDLQTRAATLCKLEGWTEVSPAPDWPTLVNRALALFSWEAEYATDDYAFLTVAGQSTYNLPSPPDWKRLTDVIYNSGSSLILTDEPTLRRENPLWTVTPATTPTRYFVSSPNTIRLYPTPLTSGISVNVHGIRTAPPLVNATDVPDIADPFHESIVELAAYLHGKIYAQGDAAARLQSYYNDAMHLADELRLSLAEQNSPNFQRFVSRRLPERLPLGWLTRLPGNSGL